MRIDFLQSAFVALRNGIAAAIVLVLVAGGCSDTTAPGELVGGWQLYSVDGEPVPTAANYPVRVVSGRLYIAGDGTFAQPIQVLSFQGARSTVFAGRHSRSAGGFRLDYEFGWNDGGYAETAELRGGELVVEGVVGAQITNPLGEMSLILGTLVYRRMQ